MTQRLTYRDASYFGGGMISIPDDEEHVGIPGKVISPGKKIVSVLEIHNVYKNKPKYNLPEWWTELIEQSEFVENTGRTTIIKLPDDSYVISGPYRESVYGWLSSVESSDFYFDRDIGGMFLENPTWKDDTNKRMSYYGLIATPLAAKHITPDTVEGRRMKKLSDEAVKNGFETPSASLFPTKMELLPHQKTAVLALANNGGGILADDVGSGKSAMFIGGYLSIVQKRKRYEKIKNNSELWPLVIVTKKSLSANTVDECEGWHRSSRVELLQGRKSKPIPKNVNFIICPINILGGRLKDILKLKPKGAVCDESHMIKSLTAKQSEAAIKLAHAVRKNSDHPYTVCASATPMPNRPIELWNQLEFCGMSDNIIKYAESKQFFPKTTRIKVQKGNAKQWMSIPTPNSKKFQDRYCFDKRGGMYAGKGSSNERELNELMKANGYIRRKKSEFITPLPLLNQNFINCSVSDSWLEKYNRAENEFDQHLIESLKDKARAEGWSKREYNLAVKDKIGKASKAERIMKMTATRQIVGEAKVDYVVDWINRFFQKDPLIVGDDKTRNKLIVFAHHKSIQKAIFEHPDLQQYGPMHISSENNKDVSSIVKNFQNPKSGKNLVICYSEAREGLTLTAAKDVLVAEMPFVPSWLIQMGGRCWARLSKDYEPHEAYLHYAVSNLGIDKYLMDMIRSKADLQKKIIDGEYAMNVINEGESTEE